MGTRSFTLFGTMLFMMLLPGIEMMSVDSIDQCIFNCYQCYSKVHLVECANDCIMMDGIVSPFWGKCQYFDIDPQVVQV